MPNVEYICPQFAILSAGEDADDGGKYHLRDLLLLKSDSRDFLSKQVQPFLEKYGMRYRADLAEGLSLKPDEAYDEPALKQLGYYIERNAAMGKRYKAVLKKDPDGMADGEDATFVVPIDAPEDAAPSIASRLDAASYAARLGLMSMTGQASGLEFDHRDRRGEAYRFTVPECLAPSEESIVLEESVGEGAAAEPLHARLRRVQGTQFELTFSLVRTYELQPNGLRKTVYFDYVPLADGEPPAGTANRIAANLMLIALTEALHRSLRLVRIDPETLRLGRHSRTTMLDDLIDAIAAGKLHACPNCGRPLIGNSAYCKHGACAQRYNERAKAAALAGGMSEAEVLEAFPSIQPKTVHSWFA